MPGDSLQGITPVHPFLHSCPDVSLPKKSWTGVTRPSNLSWSANRCRLIGRVYDIARSRKSTGHRACTVKMGRLPGLRRIGQRAYLAPGQLRKITPALMRQPTRPLAEDRRQPSPACCKASAVHLAGDTRTNRVPCPARSRAPYLLRSGDSFHVFGRPCGKKRGSQPPHPLGD